MEVKTTGQTMRGCGMKNLSIIYHPRGCKTCMEYSQHIMEAELMKDDNYIVASKGRKEEANFLVSKSQQVC